MEEWGEEAARRDNEEAVRYNIGVESQVGPRMKTHMYEQGFGAAFGFARLPVA